jgi:hypothetical protein
MHEVLNDMTTKDLKDFLNRLGPESSTEPKALTDPKSLTGPGGTLESIVNEGRVIQIPNDVIDCGFGNRSMSQITESR